MPLKGKNKWRLNLNHHDCRNITETSSSHHLQLGTENGSRHSGICSDVIETMCHSGWPFCTRLGLATGLVGRLPSRLLRYPRHGGLAGSLTWIGWLPPLRMRVDTVPYPHACTVSPPKLPYIRRHIGLRQAVRVWQSVSPDSWVAHNPGPSWDFRLGLCLARSPLHRRICLVLVVHLVVI